MLLKKFKPISNSNRHKVRICKNKLIKTNRLLKSLNNFAKKSNGRCFNTGSITVRHKGAGCKTVAKKLTNIGQNKKTITLGICYDPNRASFISLKFDLNRKEFLFDVALDNEHPGTLLESNAKSTDLKLGFRGKLTDIPTGSIESLVGINNSGQAKYIKSAGNYGQIVNKTAAHSFVKLPSGKIKKFKNEETASVGAVSNSQHSLQIIGTAGTNRRLNKRPTVRGIAMNPVDHPHGGRTNGGRPSVTPWGLPTKGKFKLKKRKYE